MNDNFNKTRYIFCSNELQITNRSTGSCTFKKGLCDFELDTMA